jgi:ABC-type polysaccharide/polyol phosphate transport system ATPase subunit
VIPASPVALLENVILEYQIPKQRHWSLKERLVHLGIGGTTYEAHRAVDRVSLEVRQGEVLAVIGSNGAGKSSLLKLMARVLPPTAGRVRVKGPLAPLLELGAAFNFEQTARENIILYGAMLGRDGRELRYRCEEITSWAGLSEYLDQPLRTFSTGMVARLAFSVAVDARPTLLLVDEFLAVGDAAFRAQSGRRISDLIDAGSAVVLVSHQLDEVVKSSTRAIWMRHGRIEAEGLPSSVVSAYMKGPEYSGGSIG